MSDHQVHFLHNGVDLGYFDLQKFTSVVDRKLKSRIEESIDPRYFRNSYVLDNNCCCSPRDDSLDS